MKPRTVDVSVWQFAAIVLVMVGASLLLRNFGGPDDTTSPGLEFGEILVGELSLPIVFLGALATLLEFGRAIGRTVFLGASKVVRSSTQFNSRHSGRVALTLLGKWGSVLPAHVDMEDLGDHLQVVHEHAQNRHWFAMWKRCVSALILCSFGALIYLIRNAFSKKRT